MTQLMTALLGLFYAGLIWAAPVPFVAVPASLSPTQARMEPLLSWFAGEFSSQEQAGYDKRFTSAELRLVEIWPGRAPFAGSMRSSF